MLGTSRAEASSRDSQIVERFWKEKGLTGRVVDATIPYDAINRERERTRSHDRQEQEGRHSLEDDFAFARLLLTQGLLLVYAKLLGPSQTHQARLPVQTQV